MKRQETHVRLCPQCGEDLGEPFIFDNKFFSSAYPFFDCKSCGYAGMEFLEAHSQEEIEKIKRELKKK